MKPRVYIISALICSIFYIDINAAEVDSTKALIVAKNFAFENYCSKQSIPYNTISSEIKQIIYNDLGIPLLYFVNIHPKGYVVVSADDRAYPVLSHSEEETWSLSRLDIMPDGAKWFINKYAYQINILSKESIIATNEIQTFWERYLNINKLNPCEFRLEVYLEEMGNLKWGQGKYYNYDCPGNGQHNYSHYDYKCPTGCVATAMAQIKRYWQWPNNGNSSKSYVDPTNNTINANKWCENSDPSYGTLSANFNTFYNWGSMPDILTGYNLDVSELIYHAGVAVEMDYSYCSSGSTMTKAKNGFINHFRYSSNADIKDATLYSWNAWEEMMKDELYYRRPIFYTGQTDIWPWSAVGHAFVCWAYQEMSSFTRFKFNWGWNGNDNNTWYTVRNVSGGNIIDYNNNQKMIINLYPDGVNVSPCTNTIVIDGTGPNYVKSFMGGGTGAWNTTTNNACGYPTKGIEKIFKFIPSNSGNYSVELLSADGWVDYMWKSGSCSSTGWDCIGSANSPGTVGNIPMIAGNTTYILLDDVDNIPGLHKFYLIPLCLDCPDYDFTITPSTSWQLHSSSHVSNGCKMYRVNVTNSQTYIFKTGCGDGATADYDTQLTLFDSNCTQNCFNDDGCENSRSKIVWTANYSGYAYLKVSGYSSDFGDYTLAYKRESPSITLTPTQHNFGNVQVGDCSGNKSFTLLNVGGGTATGNVALSGTNANQFTIVSGGGNFSLNANQEKTIEVKFCPTSEGSKTASLDATGSGGTNSESSSLNGTGILTPDITLTPTSHNFGNVQVGDCSGNKSFTLKNVGGGTATGIVALSGTNANQFTFVSGGGSFSLTSNQEKTIVVKFCPTSTGIKTASLDATGSGGTNSETSSLSGTGILTPDITLTPTSHNFVNVQVGDCSSDVSFTLKNVGGGTATGNVALSGTNANQFTIVSGGGNFSLNANQEKIIVVKFCPTSEGSKTASLDATGSGGTNSESSSLSGTGILAPSITLTPTSHNFGNVQVDNCSSNVSFTLKNEGGGTATGNVVLSGANANQFTIVSGGGSFSLTSNQEQTIVVKFCPTSPGIKTASLYATGSGGTNSESSSLSGTGILAPSITLTPTSHNFVNVPVGDCSSDVSFTLKNVGGGTATGNVALSGTNADQFTIVSGGGSFSLTANQEKTVVVKFCPTSTGSKTASLNATGSGETNNVSSSLSGFPGTDPNITLTPSSFNFGNIQIGNCSSDVSFTLKNVGGGTATGNVALSGTNANQFTIVLGQGGFSLNANQEQTIVVKFCPTSTGSKTASLDATGSGGTNSASSSLSGSGITIALSPTNQTVASQEGSINVTVTSNVTWDISESCTWVTCSPTSGSNNGSFTVTYQANTNMQSRDCTITVSGVGGAPSATFVLTQQGTPGSTTIAVNPTTLDYGDVTVGQSVIHNYQLTGSNLTANITVNAPTGYQVSKQEPSGYANQISVQQNGGSINQTIYVKFTPTAAQQYNGDVVNSSTGAGTQNVTVSGTGVNAQVYYLDVQPSEIILSAMSGSNSIMAISTNDTWSISGNQTWLDLSATNGNNNSIVTLTANSNNPLNENRTCYLSINTNHGLNNQVKVTQQSFVGICEKEITPLFVIKPNPVFESFSVNTKCNAPIMIVVYNSIGKSIISESFYQNEFQINLSGLPSGVYLVKLICDEHAITKKIVKM